MDITEAFRGEDISKTDFFDFVVTPDVGEHQQALTFNRTLKSMGIFIESAESNNNNPGTTAFQDAKEANNNHLMMATSSLPTSDLGISNCSDHAFWSTNSSCDKETVRLETAILEDLNKFCWSQDSGAAAEVPLPNTNGGGSCHKAAINSSSHNNTDGAIYTLTVLNGGDHGATWYRTPEAPTNLKEEEENHQTSPPNMENHSSALDLESILSIIPNQTQPTSANGHQFHQNGYQPQPNDSAATLSPHQDGLVKSEQQYAYEDSGYANKLVQQEANAGDGSTGFNNNNDWKLANNNSAADSLLRSALQGKSFLGRYNGSSKNGKAVEGHIELRRALSTPPNGAKTPPVFITGEMGTDDCSGVDQKQSPLMTVTMEGNAVVMFDGGGEGRGLLADSDNPSSAHSMEDILLSQLDAASYPEDYEKLKRIANEVAESVNQYCSMEQGSLGSPSPHTPPGIYISTHLATAENLVPNSILSSPHHHHHLSPILASKASKKYGKKQPGGSSSKSAHQLQNSSVRKERSLHYCSICSKGFKDKYSVNVHIRTHTGEKPFACSLCGKSFRQKAHLAKHYQTHIAQKNAAANSNGVSKPGGNKARYSNSKPS